ncbi:MAG: hypothetical protein JNM88_11065 [Chitinophagaceae bacterium]|nr:hypothetical protein [Chitinophagaceae bacterium]
MKKISFALIAFSLFAVATGCSKNAAEPTVAENESEAPLLKQAGHITYEITSKNPFRIKSDLLREVSVNIEGKQIIGYIHTDVPAEKTKEQPPVENNIVMPADGWSIVWGHFFYGECLVYGALWTGNNGVSLFVPCPLNQCIGQAFAPICPPPGGGIAKGGN